MYRVKKTEPMMKCAVSNTGTMLSAFQSGQSELLKFLYDRIYVPSSELPEYSKHEAGTLIQKLIDSGFVMICHLTQAEKISARQFSEETANHPVAKSNAPQDHYPEAEARVLMHRVSLQATEILLDELAAREIAKGHGLSVVGFPGVVSRARLKGMVTPVEVKEILLMGQQEGAHCSDRLIKVVYDSLRR